MSRALSLACVEVVEVAGAAIAKPVKRELLACMLFVIIRYLLSLQCLQTCHVLVAPPNTVVVLRVFLLCVRRPHGCRYTEFSGFHGILAGLLVAVKQIMPNQEVILGGIFRTSARVSRVCGLLLSFQHLASNRPLAAAVVAQGAGWATRM